MVVPMTKNEENRSMVSSGEKKKTTTMMSLTLEISDAMEEDIHVEMPAWHSAI